jgi:hypothetical protein
MKQKKQTVKTRDNNSKRKRAFSRASLMLIAKAAELSRLTLHNNNFLICTCVNYASE